MFGVALQKQPPWSPRGVLFLVSLFSSFHAGQRLRIVDTATDRHLRRPTGQGAMAH
jgi:hypothetical protein